MPEKPLKGQSQKEWMEWSNEDKATLELKLAQEEKERQIELDKKLLLT